MKKYDILELLHIQSRFLIKKRFFLLKDRKEVLFVQKKKRFYNYKYNYLKER